MKKDIANRIIEKATDIEIGQFNNTDDFIITHKTLDRRVVVNQKTKTLFDLVDNNSTLTEIVQKYNQIYPDNSINVETANAVLYENLGKSGIIINEDIAVTRKNIASYLALSFTVIPKSKLPFFTRLLYPIFNFNHYYKVLIGCFLFVTYTVLTNKNSLVDFAKDATVSNIGVFILFISLITVFFHEFGHATACKKLGAEPGAIGFGFYLLKPVMFADVSDIWKLNSKERIYVNLAGMYVEILIATLLCIAFHIVKIPFLLALVSIILTSFLINLNPFLRYDGYWILSDITHTPNLRQVANEKVTEFSSAIFKRTSFEFSLKNSLLVVYGLISYVFIIGFLSFAIFYQGEALLKFPINVFNYIKSLFNGNPFTISDLKRFMIPFLFYFVVFRFLRKPIAKLYKKETPKSHQQ